MSFPIQIQAGAEALTRIRQHGLRADDISMLIGASGGPKWFCLYGLDQYFTSEFFAARQHPLQLLGSSAGAWRFACYGQQDAAGASERFCQAYRTLCYAKNASRSVVSAKSLDILQAIFPSPDHIQQVIENPTFQLHLVVAKSGRLTGHSSSAALLASLTLAAGVNLLSRQRLGWFYQRLLFQHPASAASLADLHDLPTRRLQLSKENLLPSLLATGAIPLVIDPVTDIAGCGAGHYVDGGITDYHFDWPFVSEGLILYPHFYPSLSPGWFDKSLPWRQRRTAPSSKLVLLSPTEKWVRSLPYGKIPDRKDFTQLSDQARLSYWQEVTERSFELSAALKAGNYHLTGW